LNTELHFFTAIVYIFIEIKATEMLTYSSLMCHDLLTT
jgi:hypothetical protein